ncbi:hypothetical protein [Aliikangiella maris]|uniref:Uncharacterized protein n=2 Tax=Aliikangiella maris TaxID=3162458 RepID=A0ABV2BYP6_9GAMM
MKNKLFLALLLFLLSGVASASIYCTGKVDNVYVANNGDVVFKAKWRNDWTRACNIKDVDTVKCSLWASYLLTAVKDNLNITVQYNSANNQTCASLPTYSNTPTPGYIMVINPTL